MRPSACLLLCSMAGLALVASGCDGTAPGDGGPGVDSGPGAEGGVFLDGGGSDGGGTDGGGGGTDAGPATCGDRRITAPEECDDGNTASGDGCDAACVIEVSPTCGNGALERAAGEECDDGNTTNGDGCDARCIVEAPSGCGDGALDLATGEECDDGNTAPGDGCAPSCQLEAVGAFCGDGTTDAGEACDDGNTTNGDGCSATCNLTGTTSAFVGAAGMAARTDGIGAAARILGNGTLAADNQYLWFAEPGGPGATAALRRIEIATADMVTVATLTTQGAEGVATNGTDTVWIATGDATTASIVSVSTAPPYTVTTVTSSAICATAGCYADGAPGTATFGGVRGLTWYAGSLWIVDPPAATIRRLDPATGDVTTVAGQAFASGTSDGLGAAARFNSPRYIVSDNSGVLYISDTNGQAIRTLTVATSRVGTFAGVPVGPTGGPAPMYVDGIGAAARIHRPRGITSDGTSIYFAEFNQHTVRQGLIVTQEITTLAGMPSATGGYVEGVGSAARFNNPWGIAYHFPSRSVFVVDGGNQVIRRIQ